MSQATWTQGNWVDFLLLVVESQITNLTPSSFGHNLCFRYPNKSCNPILNIYVSIFFQWYKELFNPMGFDPCNFPLKIQESIGTPTPKMGVQLGVWKFIPSHSFALSGAWKCDSWASLLACNLVSFRFGCEPKVRVATQLFIIVQ